METIKEKKKFIFETQQQYINTYKRNTHFISTTIPSLRHSHCHLAVGVFALIEEKKIKKKKKKETIKKEFLYGDPVSIMGAKLSLA